MRICRLFDVDVIEQGAKENTVEDQNAVGQRTRWYAYKPMETVLRVLLSNFI